jgi:hypothetical protein
VPYKTSDARAQLLQTLAQATEELASGLSALTEAYELADEGTADRLERDLFNPLQLAYARARRTHTEFAERHELPDRTFQAPVAGAPRHGLRGFLDSAADAVARAEGTLAGLQDSMLPVEVGDPPLRAGLEQVRELIGHFPARTRELERTLGR